MQVEEISAIQEKSIDSLFSKDDILKISIIILGAVLNGCALNSFLAPHKFLAGGVTGIATLLYFSTGIPNYVYLWIINIPIFIIAFKRLSLKTSIISDIHLNTKSDNLEDIYMEMYERNDCEVQRRQLEDAIEKYFCQFELPDKPTIYDLLVLSLTKKDLIATFNWDPLLVEAYTRCTKITTNLPQMAFLHGNVAIATCEEDMVLGRPYGICSRCGKMLSKVPLLYPIREKNYDTNPYISLSWKQLGQYLERAYRLTVFGYSAPKSDKAAVEMLKKAWGAVADRNLEEIEIIDIRSEEEVAESWNGFIHTHHYSVLNNFFDSALGKFPRRTCELLFDNTQKNRWMHGNKGFKTNMEFAEIESYLQKLLEDEKLGKEILKNPYV